MAEHLRAADESEVTRAFDFSESYRRWRESRLGQTTDALEKALILDLLGPVQGLRILDVGCGDGVLAVALARRGARVTGLDTDPRMLAAARRRAASESVDVRLVLGRAEALPFAAASFDRVLAVTVLCFVLEQDRAVREMARLLEPGAHLVIGELGRWSSWALLRRIRGWLGAPIWRRARFHTASDLRARVETHGLAVNRVAGSIYYPPSELAAALMARFDARFARLTTLGAAFIAIDAVKPSAAHSCTRVAAL